MRERSIESNVCSIDGGDWYFEKKKNSSTNESFCMSTHAKNGVTGFKN